MFLRLHCEQEILVLAGVMAPLLKNQNQYLNAGGNFIDTADVYQFGQSEQILGDLLQGIRNEVVLATKFSSGASPDANRFHKGNSRKAMFYSVEQSLRRLKTDYIDIYWVHHPDNMNPSEEILRGLEDLSRAGKNTLCRAV